MSWIVRQKEMEEEKSASVVTRYTYRDRRKYWPGQVHRHMQQREKRGKKAQGLVNKTNQSSRFPKEETRPQVEESTAVAYGWQVFPIKYTFR